MTQPKAAAIYMVKASSTYELANLADVSLNGGPDGAGASFLNRIKDDVEEFLDRFLDAEDDCVNFDRADDDGSLHEIADGAVPVYNSDLFDTLHDLSAYYEDISDLGTPKDMIQAAQWSLYEVARNVVARLMEVAEEAFDEAVSENEDHDDDPSLDMPSYTS